MDKIFTVIITWTSLRLPEHGEYVDNCTATTHSIIFQNCLKAKVDELWKSYMSGHIATGFKTATFGETTMILDSALKSVVAYNKDDETLITFSVKSSNYVG